MKFSATAMMTTALALTCGMHAGCVTLGMPVPDARRADYERMLDAAVPLLGDADPARQLAGRTLVESLSLDSTRAGATTDVELFCTALVARLESDLAPEAQEWLLRQLQMIGGEESVEPLARLLAAGDERQRELARRALQANPSPRAGVVLRDALAEAQDRPWRIALIDALGARGEPQAVALLREVIAAREDPVTRAALAALGNIDDPAAADALIAEARLANTIMRNEASDALLRIAQRCLEAGDRETAARYSLLVFLSTAGEHPRRSAMILFTKAAGIDALPRLRNVIFGELDPLLRPDALRLVGGIPGEESLRILREAWNAMTTTERLVILAALHERRDPASMDLALQALESPSVLLRTAAADALALLGDASCALPLAAAAGRADGSARQALRRALRELPDARADELLAFGLADLEPAGRAEALMALGERGYAGVIDLCLGHLGEQEPAVLAAAIQVIGQRGSAVHVARLAAALDALSDDADALAAGEDAIMKLLAPQDPLAHLLEAWPGEPGPALVRIAGRIGSAEALDLVRRLLDDSREEVRDAARRALCDWPGDAAWADVERIATEAEATTQRVLAVRGLVRMAGLATDADERLRRLERALALAPRDDERQLVLGALSGVYAPEALRRAESLLEHEALRAEAIAAVTSIAVALVAGGDATGTAALERLAARDLDAAQQAALDAARQRIDDLAGRVTAWSWCGPFTQEGQAEATLFDQPLGPELPDAACEWRPLLPTGEDPLWVSDLMRVDGLAGENRCVYLRSELWSPRERLAVLRLGSDDGLKAWLNGELVHAAGAPRGHSEGSDEVSVTLREGWNTLMLKVVQHGGGWMFSCTVTPPTPEPLRELRTRRPE